MNNPKISLIAAIASGNRALGKDNKLIYHIHEDLQRFKKLTSGHPVIMGRKTFESILKQLGKPLPNRINVVITRDPKYAAPEGVEIFTSVDDALRLHYNEEVMVIGGGEIFRQTIDRATTLHITEVDQTIEGDVYFPRIDPTIWKETERENHKGYSFVMYKHK